MTEKPFASSMLSTFRPGRITQFSSASTVAVASDLLFTALGQINDANPRYTSGLATQSRKKGKRDESWKKKPPGAKAGQETYQAREGIKGSIYTSPNSFHGLVGFLACLGAG